ncbi:unnamed protein product [Cuscuta epithymum]|uniref:Telomerase reverse transcriptase n=2 Tax=Cuscuta epithymum TaxID=186058 RepID=A0AAV0CWU6_9ASTE|nr:unnamed protein product [Cuscuta epithymum]
MAKKKRRVPDVLWRLFHNHARTLFETIKSLIPPLQTSAADCRCNGRGCLSCGGANSTAFILTPTDPPEYRKLLNHCFVVLDENAPALSVFQPQHRRSQFEIVRTTIEMMMSEHPTSSNLILHDYYKTSCPSSISALDLLTSEAWCLLLKRVGDVLMVYILRNFSIFLPLPQNKLHQVAGFPISDLCLTSSKRTALGSAGSGKRKTTDEMWSMSMKHLCSRLRITKEESPKETLTSGGDSCISKGSHSLAAGQVSSNHCLSSNRKRKRPNSWQRRRKRQLLATHEAHSLNPCRNSTEIEEPPSTLPHKIHTVGWCSCCLVFCNPLKDIDEVIISRNAMLYKLENCSTVFPRKHILNSLKHNSSGANNLFNEIFGSCGVTINGQISPCVHTTKCCCTRATCLYHSLIRMLEVLIRKSQCCRHLRLLEKHCPIPSLDEVLERVSFEDYQGNQSTVNPGAKDPKHSDELMGDSFSSETRERSEAQHSKIRPSVCYSLKKQVVSFIWAVCRNIVPPDLLGIPSNWRILTKNISRLIQMRRYEKFSFNQCLHKVKISRFPLLSGMFKDCGGIGALDVVKHKVLHCWIFWFFSYLVVPLVQANFYVTETEHENQEVLYYRKSIWNQVKAEGRASLNDQQFLELDVPSVSKILRNRAFGFSRARFRPKKNGLRILENLKAPSRIRVKLASQFSDLKKAYPMGKVKYEYFRSVNCALRDLHAVLKGVQVKEPVKLGSSVFNYNDVYNKLVPFLMNIKNGSATIPDAYIIVSDVAKAFDTINQDKLLTVMESIVSDEEYALEKSFQVVCTKRSLWVNQNLTLAHDNIIPSNAFRPLHHVFVKQERGRNVKKGELTFYLNEHIKRNVLLMDTKFYLQCLGIPQGSVISSLLCSFYYGYLENNLIFPFLEKVCKSGNGCEDELVEHMPKYLLLRLIDDFLFISTSRLQASSFFCRLRRGFHEFNCYMNEEKFGLNFDMNHLLGLRSNRLYAGDDGISFLRWSGLFVNCCTLEIQADYTRYLSTHLSSTQTVIWKGRPVRELKSKLCRYLRPKCHPIFFDSNINSAAVVRLNIYQAFLLCAMKFHCYISDLARIARLSTKSYFDVLETSLRHMKKRIKHIKKFTSEIPPIIEVEMGEIEWLGLIAYIRVLMRKQSRYRELLPLLKSKLMAVRYPESLSPALKYATDDIHSSTLWKIRY